MKHRFNTNKDASWLAAHARIPDDIVLNVLVALVATGVFDDIKRWTTSEKSRGGRPSTLPFEALLVGLVVTAFVRRSVNLVDITEVIYEQINPKMRKRLGIVEVPTERSGYDRVRRKLEKLIEKVDPSDERKNRIEKREPLRERTADEKNLCAQRLHRLANALIEATIRMVPEDVLDRWTGSLALDATALPQYTRGGEGGAIPSDPDAGWYVRDDQPDGPPFGKGKRGKAFVAFEASFAVMASSELGGADHPNLVVGIRLHRPGVEPGMNGAEVVKTVHATYDRKGFLAADRAYNNSVPEKFQSVLSALGYMFLFDYRYDQLGVQAQHAGAIQVEGTWYCPSLPKELINATRDFRDGKIDYDLWQKRIAERQLFELRVKDSSQRRFACPASGPSPSVGCPLRQGDAAGDFGKRLIEVVPSHPDRICTNATSVSFDNNAGAKHAQSLPYGSPLQQKLYAQIRNTVEGFNGSVKDGANAGLGDPTRRRLRGLANQTVLASAMVAAGNMIRLRNWLANVTTVVEDDPLSSETGGRTFYPQTQLSKRYRRKREPPPKAAAA